MSSSFIQVYMSDFLMQQDLLSKMNKHFRRWLPAFSGPSSKLFSARHHTLVLFTNWFIKCLFTDQLISLATTNITPSPYLHSGWFLHQNIPSQNKATHRHVSVSLLLSCMSYFINVCVCVCRVCVSILLHIYYMHVKHNLDCNSRMYLHNSTMKHILLNSGKK